MYELWDVETGNLIAEYATETAALAVVSRSIEADGARAVDCLALLLRAPTGGGQLVAEGSDLARRAEAVGKAAGHHPRVTAPVAR